MFTPEKYRRFMEKFRELDRVFDTVVKRSARMGRTVYVEGKILSSFPREYLDYYMTTRRVLITSMPAYHRIMPVKNSVLSISKRYVAINRLMRASAGL